ncbi:DinB family protein [Ferruginibacter profundus]
MERAIVIAIDETTTELLQAIAQFTDEQFNRIPFEGSWTAAQVAEHLYKSEAGFPVILKSSTVAADRAADEKAATIRSLFLDFTTKLKSPDFILPSNEPKEKETLYNAIKNNREEITGLIASTDLTRIFPEFPFPQLGEFTGLEWLTFLVCHSKRHTFQLKTIYEKVK